MLIKFNAQLSGQNRGMFSHAQAYGKDHYIEFFFGLYSGLIHIANKMSAVSVRRHDPGDL